MNRPGLIVVALAAAVLGVGCSGGSGSATSTTTDGVIANDRSETEATLRRSAQAALHANVRLSTYVLWHNRVPASAQESTRGPALRALRDAAADRRREGIRIQSLSSRYRVIRLQLDPSYTRAEAVVHDQGRVVPYRNGRTLGKAINLNEQARIELRRLGKSTRFVVWQVTPLR